jgi:hypothetical protein
LQPTVLESEWYDQKEALRILNIAERTLRTWVSQGRIRTKLNPANTRQRLYKAQDVDHLAKEGPPEPATRKQRMAKTRPAGTTLAPVTLLTQVLDALAKERSEARERWEQEQRLRLEQTKPWLTLEQAMELSNLPARAIRFAVKEGKLIATRKGGLRILKSSLEKFEG